MQPSQPFKNYEYELVVIPKEYPIINLLTPDNVLYTWIDSTGWMNIATGEHGIANKPAWLDNWVRNCMRVSTSQYCKDLLTALKGQLHNYDESEWMLDAVVFHEGEQHTVEQAVSEILDTLSQGD